ESGHGNGARDARHDLKWNSRFRQRVCFFAASAEHKRIAAFEPADVLAFTCLLDHQPVDVLLLDVLLALLFPDADDFCGRLCLFEQMQVDQSIMQHDIGFAQTRQPADRYEIRISRPRANDINRTDVFHDSMISFSRRFAPTLSLRFKRSMISESRIRYCNTF